MVGIRNEILKKKSKEKKLTNPLLKKPIDRGLEDLVYLLRKHW